MKNTIFFPFFLFSEILLCKRNPCHHAGKCTIINSRQFSCDCQHTGYEGDLCEIGIVTLPDFPKLISGSPSESLVLQAKPEDSLIINYNSATNLTIQPKVLIIKHPASKAEFKVTGHKAGVGMLSYNLGGMNKDDFSVPNNSFLFIGRNISTQHSIYTRLGLLSGELPIGTQKKTMANYAACCVRVAYNENTTMSNGNVIEAGPVHIITPDNRTIPLSLVGYNFSSLTPSRNEIIERLLRNTGDLKESAHAYSDNQLTPGGVIEFIQKDALPKSFMRYFADQLPLWLKVKVTEGNQLFDLYNTQAYLVQTKKAHIFYSICKFPISNESVVTLYHPTVNYNISIENEQLSLSSKGSCFVTNICHTGVFLTLPQKASNKVSTMQFMQDMANGGWKILVSSFGFTAKRRYSGKLTAVPDGHLAENFSDFHYNLWLKGRANIYLSGSSYFSVNLTMTGEAFVFTDVLNAVSIIFKGY